MRREVFEIDLGKFQGRLFLFEKLSIKFKELRSLAINYKDDKEKEINKLGEEINNFKEKIEKSKNSYEEILDKTTKSIEKFI